MAYDLLAAWIRRGPEGERDIQKCWSHDDGTIEIILRHEHGEARSVTQRTMSSAIRSALGIARYQDAG